MDPHPPSSLPSPSHPYLSTTHVHIMIATWLHSTKYYIWYSVQNCVSRDKVNICGSYLIGAVLLRATTSTHCQKLQCMVCVTTCTPTNLWVRGCCNNLEGWVTGDNTTIIERHISSTQSRIIIGTDSIFGDINYKSIASSRHAGLGKRYGR